MNTDIPYVETHLTTPMLVVDIQFNNGGRTTGRLCRSFTFDSGSLVLYKDIVYKDREYFENVRRIEVTSEVFGGV